MRVYRITVDQWPTPDGKPWARSYGPRIAVPNNGIPVWLQALVDVALPLIYSYRDRSDLGRIADRIRYDGDRDVVDSVLMPLPKRVNYLSAPGVAELAADMRAFGAVVRIAPSNPVTWPEEIE